MDHKQSPFSSFGGAVEEVLHTALRKMGGWYSTLCSPRYCASGVAASQNEFL